MLFASAASGQSAAFEIGDMVEVYVQDDGLSLRAEPGAQNPLLEKLPSGTQVEVIGGPVSDGTYTWWNVRTASNIEGWSVEAADGIQTLVPVVTIELEGVEVISAVPLSEAWGVEVVWSPDDTRAVVNTFNQSILLVDVELGSIIAMHPLVESFDPYMFWSANPTIQWSVDGSYIWLAEFGPEDEIYASLILNGETGAVTEGVDPAALEWLEKPANISHMTGCPSDPCFDNAEDVFIEFEAGRLQAGNPATFTSAAGTEQALGDGRGGLLWGEGSNRAVIWADLEFESNEALWAEVWNLETGTRIARVPHNALYQFAGAPFPQPAFLSNDGTLLAAAFAEDDTYLNYTLTFYRLPDTPA